MREEERLPGRQSLGHAVLVDLPHVLVGHEEHDDVGGPCGVGDAAHVEARGFRLRPRCPARPEPDHDLLARLLQVERVRVALAAEADDGDGAAEEAVDIGIAVVEHLERRAHDTEASVEVGARGASAGRSIATAPLRATSTMPKRSTARRHGEHERVGTGQLDDEAVGTLFQDVRVIEAEHIEQLAVVIGLGADADERELAHHGVGGRHGARFIHADQLLEQQRHPLRCAFICLDHRKEPRASLGDMGSEGHAPYGKVAAAEKPDGRVQGHQLVVQDHGDAVEVAHAEAGSAGAVSITSESDAPGGIIGYTLASCSITNSMSAGPGSRSAASIAPAICDPVSTR